MTVNEAAEDLWQKHFASLPGEHPWIQGIAVAEVGQYNDTARIHMMLVRKPMPHEGQVPKEWHGYLVVAKVIGRIKIGAPR